jgi:hypothetical protein
VFKAGLCLNIALGMIKYDFGSNVLVIWTRVMIDRDGWGFTYCKARGEILGPLYDEQLRKHLARTFPLIKNES